MMGLLFKPNATKKKKKESEPSQKEEPNGSNYQ
jgi:hypothetical protein